MAVSSPTVDQLAVTTIRTLAMDAVEAAQSGHPGLPMGAAPMAYVLWTRFLRHNPRDPGWVNRDRFVLSAGHGSLLLYALLYLTGYDLTLDDIKRFRQWGSKTPGHPEYGLTPGVEATTGPLGQGIGMAVGMAMAEAFLRGRYNRPELPVVDHYTYALVSDGDLMEGISGEAASLAGHLGLGRLIVLYDDNHITIEGDTGLAFTEDVGARFNAYGWHVQRIADGNDLAAVADAIAAAQAETHRPSLIAVRTHLAYGAPHKQDSPSAHGSPLGAEEVRATKAAYGWPTTEPFWVPEAVLDHCRTAVADGKKRQAAWEALWRAYRAAYPDLAEELEAAWQRRLPSGWDRDLGGVAEGEPATATRTASGRTLQALAKRIPTLLGGSADLAPSNDTRLAQEAEFGPPSYTGRNLHFGVREHAMGAALNGMALHGGVRPYGGTFLVFSDYLRPAIRLAALMRLPVIYVFTHDSLGLGEDGPTHQPVEHLAALRAIPGLTVIRPADANETQEAWRWAVGHPDAGPVALALSRQALPVLPAQAAQGLARGAYVLDEADGPARCLLLATGSEVHLARAARLQLQAQGIPTRVVSMPSWELFEQQPEPYRLTVLPPTLRARVAIEAAARLGWERYVGEAGQVIGVDRFGASAPGAVVLREYGFTVEHVVEVARSVVATAEA